MPSANGKGGLLPIDSLGSNARNWRTREFQIASNYATSIFKGDLVLPVSDGTIARAAFNFTAGTALGVFMGCRFTHPVTKQIVYSNFYPASTVASDIFALVYDDPKGVFLIQGDAALAATNLFNNADLVQTATGSTVNGLSGMNLSSSSANTTNTLRFRIVGLYNQPGNAWTDSFPQVLVTYNAPGFHFYDQATGI